MYLTDLDSHIFADNLDTKQEVVRQSITETVRF